MMRRALQLASITAIAVLAASATNAHGASGLRAVEVAHGVGPAIAGPRYAAFLEARTQVRVLDTVAGTSRALQVPAGCDVVDVSSGSVLLECPGGTNPDPLIYRTSDGGQEPLPWHAAEEAAETRGVVLGLQAIGRFWVALRAYTPQSSERWYLDRQTGEIATDPASARSIADLGVPRLIRPLCAPLRRTSTPPTAGLPGTDAFAPYLYDRPYGISVEEAGFMLQRCGRARGKWFACAAGCTDVELGSGAVSWRRGDSVFIRELTCRRTFRVRTGAAPVRAVSHTRRWIVVSVVPRPGRINVLRAVRTRSSCAS